MAVGFIGLMTLQAVLGLLLQGEYRDLPWVAATWFGNDWINQVINRYCQKKWVLYVDADEFLVYPHCDTRPIGQCPRRALLNCRS